MRYRRRLVLVRAIALVMALLTLLPGAASAVATMPRASSQASDSLGERVLSQAIAEAPRAADRRLLATFPPTTRVAFHAATGRVRFLAGSPAAPLARAATLAAIAHVGPRTLDPEAAARVFLAHAGPLFGLADGAAAANRDLVMERVSAASGGRRFVRFAQQVAGVPVLGGELIVQLDRRGDVTSASGELLPAADRPATVRPRLTVAAARRVAAAFLAREAGTPRAAVTTATEGLAILDPRILGGPPLPGRAVNALVWQIDARALPAPGAEPVHQLVLVDASAGVVATSIGRVAEGLDRRICDFHNHRQRDFRCFPPYTRQEGDAPSGIGQVDDAYRLMGVVDAYYRSHLGRNGIDGQGEPMIATVRYCEPHACPLQNAFWEWGPQQAAFGDGWASADDIVAHEFTHGVQDHEDRLFYYYQSGAINEALADIFGEFTDLTDGIGNDTAGARWKIGEDMPVGPLRDMQDPGKFGDPDRVGSPRWWTSSRDNGGAHVNSGVANKAASLMTDGGTFNGRHVVAIGLPRAERIWYEAMTQLLTSAADYNDLFDALQQACLDLVGSGGITFAHCRAVQEAVTATQMDQRPRAAAPSKAPVCAGRRFPVNVFADDLERPDSGNWISEVVSGTRNPWFYPQNPNTRADWDATWASSGSLNIFGDDVATMTDAAMTMTTPVTLPAGAFLRFEHGFRFDSGPGRYDGGVVEISVDGGSWKDLRAAFTSSGYNGTLATGRGNPLGGRRAFTGDSLGWGASRVDLSSWAGHDVRIRFRIASDTSVGDFGWFIDDVRIYRCVADHDRPTGSVTINAGDAITRDRTVDVAITGSDATSAVTRLRISNRATLRHGVLRDGLEMPFTGAVRWLTTDSAWGGTNAEGSRRVYVQLQDRAGNWSAVLHDEILVDSLPPAVGVPATRLVAGTQIAATAPEVPVHIVFTASDATTGVARTVLERRRDGGSWDAVDLGSDTGRAASSRLGDVATTTWEFRAQARDGAGGWSANRLGGEFHVRAIQEDGAWRYAGHWARVAGGGAYRGALRTATAAGARATIDFTGTDVALVGVTGPDRGIATIWLDGHKVATLDLYTAQRSPRTLVYAKHLSRAGRHTLSVHVTGRHSDASTGTHVDVDAVVVLLP